MQNKFNENLAKSYIKDSAKLLQLLYNVGNFEYCVGRYRTLKNWKKIAKIPKSSEKEMKDLEEELRNIRKISGNFTVIPAKSVIEIFNNACKEELKEKPKEK